MSLPSSPPGRSIKTALAATSSRSSARSAHSTVSSTKSGRSQQPLVHIQDLQDRAVEGLDKNQSITTLVTTAENSLRQACILLEYRKPDLAYGEYLRCYEIVCNFVYHNPAFPTFKNSRGPAYLRYNNLIKRLTEREQQFTAVKEIIDNDNKRNDTNPRLPAVLLPDAREATEGQPSTASQQEKGDSTQGQSQAGGESGAPLRNVSSAPQSSQGLKKSPSDILNERFAKLRLAQKLDTKVPPDPNVYASPTSMTSPVVPPQSSFEHNYFSPKPGGPRPMNGGLRMGPAGLEMDDHLAAAMPTPPTPAYTPARNMQITGDIQLPRSSARSMVGTGGRSNSLASSVASASTAVADEEPSQSTGRPSLGSSTGRVRRKSVYLPKETRIGAEKLYDYLKMHSVLIIDCRSRQDFDSGHIYAPAIMCIEPSLLSRDQSAEELQERLILSPEHEQDLFASRDTFDLVVYYDAASSDDSYLKNPRTDTDIILRCLHDTLLEFNEDKPLQRPPILLMGGIGAWVDLVGNQALQMSNTTNLTRLARPVRRIATAPKSQRLQYQKRRLRDYNPLDPEEEQNWRERARKESVTVEATAGVDGEEAAADNESMLESIDEFNRRFPDAASIGQKMLRDERASYPPPIPQKILEYPAAPAHSQPAPLPSIPKRPAPAAPRMSYSGVNERSVSQTRTADLPAYVPLHLQPSNLRLPRTGLVNFGVTCYMNATIQALSATLPLSAFFLDDRYKGLVQRENWKGSKGVLPDLFANLVRSIWKGDVEAIRPSTLRQFCARLNREWGLDRQQDAKEFFDFIVDCLHEDLNKNWSRTPLRALTEEQEIKREKMPKSLVSKTEWERYTHREQSYLTNMFAGQHASRLKCTVCGFTSTTYEAFYSISVEIPRSGKSSIEDCLTSYCQEEMLSGDEVWKCPQCKKQREATKQITITRAPQFLVVHFKRFAAGKNESAKKVRTPIDFPLQNFDLEPYMLAPPTASERKSMYALGQLNGLDKDSKSAEISMTPPYLYDAYAVMRHIGTTLGSGHYICSARDRARGCWRQFNDTMTTDFEPDKIAERDRLTNEMAYIVFYERKVGR